MWKYQLYMYLEFKQGCHHKLDTFVKYIISLWYTANLQLRYRFMDAIMIKKLGKEHKLLVDSEMI